MEGESFYAYPANLEREEISFSALPEEVRGIAKFVFGEATRVEKNKDGSFIFSLYLTDNKGLFSENTRTKVEVVTSTSPLFDQDTLNVSKLRLSVDGRDFRNIDLDGSVLLLGGRGAYGALLSGSRSDCVRWDEKSSTWLVQNDQLSDCSDLLFLFHEIGHTRQPREIVDPPKEIDMQSKVIFVASAERGAWIYAYTLLQSFGFSPNIDVFGKIRDKFLGEYQAKAELFRVNWPPNSPSVEDIYKLYKNGKKSFSIWDGVYYDYEGYERETDSDREPQFEWRRYLWEGAIQNWEELSNHSREHVLVGYYLDKIFEFVREKGLTSALDFVIRHADNFDSINNGNIAQVHEGSNTIKINLPYLMAAVKSGNEERLADVFASIVHETTHLKLREMVRRGVVLEGVPDIVFGDGRYSDLAREEFCFRIQDAVWEELVGKRGADSWENERDYYCERYGVRSNFYQDWGKGRKFSDFVSFFEEVR